MIYFFFMYYMFVNFFCFLDLICNYWNCLGEKLEKEEGKGKEGRVLICSYKF